MSYTSLTTDKSRVEFIREMLKNNDQWILKGLVAIFDRQTADEQATEQTRDWNSVGFTGTDGEILTSFTKQLLRKNYQDDIANGKAYPIRSYFSEKQERILRRRMPKYARQLVRISKGDV